MARHWAIVDAPPSPDIPPVVISAQGTAQLELDQLAEALESFKQDLSLSEGLKSDEGKSRALGSLGRVFARQGDYSEAIDVWTQKVPLSTNSLESAWLYHEIGRCYVELGNDVSALDYGQKSLACALEAIDSVWELNASVLVAQSQGGRTWPPGFAEKEETAAHVVSWPCLFVAKLGDLQDAKASFERAQRVATRLGDDRAKVGEAAL